MILLGYHTSGAYKLYNPITKKITASKDVTFDEKNSWKQESQNYNSTSHVDFEFFCEQGTHVEES